MEYYLTKKILLTVEISIFSVFTTSSAQLNAGQISGITTAVVTFMIILLGLSILVILLVARCCNISHPRGLESTDIQKVHCNHV